MATKKATEEETMLAIEIPAIEQKVFNLTIVGDSALIVHAWTEKAKKEILDKQMQKASKGKEKKNPIRDYVTSMYWIDDKGRQVAPPKVNDFESEEDEVKEYARIQEIVKNSTFGFPVSALKACALDSAYQQGIIQKKTTAKGAFHIQGEFAKIEGTPEIREDMVRVGGISKTADIRYRGCFNDWKITMQIQYNPTVISASQITNMFNIGGFAGGIGEWRVSKNGEFGRFHIESAN